jgi:hypothetical protein
MSFTSVDISVRPIKIAFLVDYNDNKRLNDATMISSVLWGGVFNAIIPVYKRLPRNLMDVVGYKFNTKESITNGYLEAFDADYVINLSSLPDNEIPLAQWRVIKDSDIFDDSTRRAKARGRGEVSYGVGIFEMLDYVEEQEFKYKRLEPLPVLDIQFGSKNSTFLAGVFGGYNDRTREVFMKRYARSIAIKSQSVSLSTYIDLLDENPVTVRRLCNMYFDEYSSGGSRQDYIFLMDASSWQDVVDYINLKALGLNVLPLPKQICMTDKANTLATDFIVKNYRKYNQNNVYYETTLLRARNCTEPEFKAFADTLKVPQEKGEHKWLYQTWYPRIWDGWARERDGVGGVQLEHKTASHEVTESKEIRIPSLKPDFIDDSFHWWRPKFANELKVRTYDGEDYIANAFPTNVERADRVLGKFASHDEWRFSSRGIVHLPEFPHEKISFKLPSAEDLYDQWQKTLGIEAHTSPPGKLARQIVRKMGVNHLNILATEGFAKLIQKLASSKGTVQSISFDKLKGEIKRFTAGKIWFDAEGFFQWIIHKEVLELGVDIECSNCGRKSWHHLNAIDKTITCTICLENIDVGLSDPKKQIVWSYRPTGPFTVPDLAQGAYTVALALNFFVDIRKMNISPRYSFVSDDGTYEADFGLLAEQRWYEGGGIAYMVGECKSFGYKNRAQFKDSEVAKLLRIGKKEKNSVIVFATLSRDLTDSDKKRFRRLVYRLREARFKKDESPEVLILTGNELFVQHDLKHSWEELGGAHKKFADKSAYFSMRELCDVTQQLYLGVEGWWDWFEQKRKDTGETK